MKNFTKLNIILGWVVFAIAAFTYLNTLEPTASFWDCGEFIAASYKLEVGHPPGAPFFLLVGRIFTLLAGGNTGKVAVAINALSGLASAFTILFLFWTITHLVKRFIANGDELSPAGKIVILGSGVVGSLAYTFSDTFWFSAVEGEVYASSSLFTAVVFWAILKWENVADTKYANRWLILIAYLMGLSIGVHLLNLLAIPAIVLIYYFKKYKVTRQGVILALLTAAGILGGVMYIIIPGLVKFAAFFERTMVNGMGLPYFSGVFIYFGLLLVLIVWGILYTQKHGNVLANTALLMVAVIIIGYSSYASIVIRSSANPPMDQNNPENMFNLLSYLNREQYGDRPLLYGQYFNAPILREKDGKPVYVPENGKYKTITHRPKYVYHSDYMTLFPRMYSNQPDHVDAYIRWTNLKKSELFEVRKDPSTGQILKDRYGDILYDYSKPKAKPGFNDNIVFLFRYQLGYMYFRYFMWNFSGRQNDTQGNFKEEINSGNWISGLKFLDAARLGNQSELTHAMKRNKARNTYFLLPLVLGLLGLFFHARADAKNFWVVMALFFFTGIAIVLYLNQNPLQPRERDYAYAGSFYAFTIWIGMAVAALYKAAKEFTIERLSKYALRGIIVIAVLGIFDFAANGRLTFTWTFLMVLIFMLLLLAIFQLLGGLSKNDKLLAALSVLLLLPVPLLMGAQNWNDHDRSGRYVARDFASNYLNSCEKNAIIFTNGDNDTFPLWYVQEVEGVRTDIRVINLSYLSADWYINQMRDKVYESEPVKMILKPDQYQQGVRDITYLVDRVKGYVDLVEAFQFLGTDEVQPQLLPGISEPIYYIPQHKFKMKADSLLVHSNGTLKPEFEDKYLPEIRWEIRSNYLAKNHLMALDFFAANKWERPICYAITVGNENYLGLDDYFEMRGLAYRIIPAKIADGIGYAGGINTDLMYENMMNRFKWGGLEEGDIYIDENCERMFSNMRHNFSNLATSLIRENKNDSALLVIQRCTELFPDKTLPYDLYMLAFVESCYKIGQGEMARDIADTIITNTFENIRYYLSLDEPYISYLQTEKQIAAYIISELLRTSSNNGDKLYNATIQQELEDLGPGLNRIFN